MRVFRPSLDDWPRVRDFYEDFCRSQYASRFDLDYPRFQVYFAQAILNPKIGVLCIEEDTEIVALSIIHESYAFDVTKGSIPQTFIHVCYVKPSTGKLVGELMNQAIEAWGTSRGHNYIVASVRVNAKNPFKLRAIDKRYGFKPLYIAIGKPIGGKTDG